MIAFHMDLRRKVIAASLLAALCGCNMTANGVNFGKLAAVGQQLTQTGNIDKNRKCSSVTSSLPCCWGQAGYIQTRRYS